MRTESSLALTLATLVSVGTAQLPVWQQKYPPFGPPVLHAITYDSVGQRALGLDFDAANRLRVWSWNGRGWTVVPTQNAPIAGSIYLAACFDSARNVLLMVRYTGGPVETWELSSSGTWSLVGALGSPSVQASFGLHYSPARSVSILIGQQVSGQPIPTSVWEYAAARWQLRPVLTAPSSAGQNTAYDSVHDRIVLFSGSGAADTWVWGGTSWTQRLPNNSPPARAAAAMAHDPARGRVVLYGGSTQNPFTWEWDGDNWHINLTAPPAAPSGRMIYDVVRGRMVFVTAAGNPETWEYFTPLQATYAPFGAACAGTAGAPVLGVVAGSLPWLGETLTVAVTNLPGSAMALPFGLLGGSSQSWSGIQLPLDLTVIGAPGCTLYTSVDAVFPLVNSAGTARWQLGIPGSVALLGGSFYQQALVLDAAANSFGAVFANGARATVGDR